MKTLVICISLLTITLISCNTENNSSLNTNPYYNIDSLIENQVKILAENKAELTKVNGHSGDTTLSIVLDTTGWEQELQLFATMDINKPALVDVYETTTLKDSVSNLLIRQYKSTAQKAEVQELNIYYFENIDNLKKISAKLHKENKLFNASRQLQMTFTDINSRSVLKSYQLNGYQKLSLRDSIATNVVGEINIR